MFLSEITIHWPFHTWFLKGLPKRDRLDPCYGRMWHMRCTVYPSCQHSTSSWCIPKSHGFTNGILCVCVFLPSEITIGRLCLKYVAIVSNTFCRSKHWYLMIFASLNVEYSKESRNTALPEDVRMQMTAPYCSIADVLIQELSARRCGTRLH